MLRLDIRHVSYLYPVLAFFPLPAAVVSQEVATNRHPVWGPSPTWSPDGAWIAFEWDRTGSPQIFRMRPDGSELRQLTGGRTKASQTNYESIGWTPDGAALTVSAGGDIYAFPLEPGPAQRLTTAEERDVHASWAPDGSAFVFGSYRDGDAEIFVAAHDGSGARPLTADEADNTAPAWSPDGRRIAFMRKGGDQWQLWIMNRDGSEARRLTRSTGNDFNPRWSPDGRWLVFESSRHEGDQDEIYVIRPDGTGERRLTDTPGNDIYPDWSPDGERIAFCTIEDGRAFVHEIPAAGGEPELLVEDACLPAWSPGGARLAFVSVARGQPERVWVAAPDGSEAMEVEGLDARPIVQAGVRS